ncbi:flagellar hook-length control protein FliK [Salinivibrio costicola]|uniref:flagellar hook-length control protein FliK n=1 Tax=Salinivibrio costicola TaxID=51367 RepID=UPI003F71DCAD
MTQSTLTLSNLSPKTPLATSDGATGEVKGDKNTGFLAALRQSIDGKGEQGDIPIKLTQDGKTLLVDGQAIDAEAMLADGMFSEAEMAEIADMTAMEESQALLMRLNQAAAMLNGKSLPTADAESVQIDGDNTGGVIDRQALLTELAKNLPEGVSPEKVLDQLSPDQLAALASQVRATQSLDAESAAHRKDNALESDGSAIKWSTAKAQQDTDNPASLSKEKETLAKEGQLKEGVTKEGAILLKSSELTDKPRHDAKSAATPNANPASLLSGKMDQSDDLSKAALKAMAEQAGQADSALTSGSASSAAEGVTRPENLAQQLASGLGLSSAQSATARQDMQAAQSAQAPLPLGQTSTEAGAALTERINIMLSKNLKQVDIRLDPPELGRMQIKLGMNNDQATVHITVANQQARDAVEQAMPRLRDMLQQQGFTVGSRIRSAARQWRAANGFRTTKSYWGRGVRRPVSWVEDR